MAGIDPRLWRMIQQGSRRYNLDPRAVAAVSMMEGGGRFGAVGDHGSSFGPWQLHVGGALPRGRGAGWANSAQGVDYALRQMARSGASGKSGRAAVSSIVSNFERPAAPGAEIAGAWSRYGGIGGGGSTGPAPTPQTTARGTPRMGTGAFGPGQVDRRQQLVAGLMAANQQFATTGRIDSTTMLSFLQNGLTNADQKAMGNVPAMRNAAMVTDGRAGKVLANAKKLLGVPYVWGGTSNKGVDCSGLVQLAYARAGIHLPRTTYDQINRGRKVGWGNFKPGDLIFSDFEGTGKPTHVVMYAGHGKVIAAPHTGDVVKYEDVNVFRKYFMGARRILK